MKKHSLVLGTELFRQAFMAVDYIEMRFSPSRASSSGSKNGRRYQQQIVQATISPNQNSERAQLIESGESSQKKPLRSHDRRATLREFVTNERGDVPGWVLVVLMTTGLVTAIWAVAAPRLNAILKNSLDSMNNIR